MQSKVDLLLAGILSFLIGFSPVEANSSAQLMDHLFNATRYDKRFVPNFGDSEPLVIYLGLNLLRIENLDEKQQLISSHVILSLEWYDEHLTWNPSDYDGTEYLSLDPNNLWLPDIVLYNSVNADNPKAIWRNKIKLHHNGIIRHQTQKIIQSSCRANVENYPFDRQECHLKFGSWSYDGTIIEIKIKNGTNELTNYVKNGEWEVEKIKSIRHVLLYACCPQPYYDITYTIKVRRQVLYYAMYYIIPCTLIALLSATIYVLPQDCSERITVGMCSLVGLSFFFLLVSENMPASSTVPLIGGYYSVTMIQMAMSFFMNILVLRFYHMTDDKMPDWIRKCVLGYAARLLRKKFNNDPSLVEKSESSLGGIASSNNVLKNTKFSTELVKADTQIAKAIKEDDEGAKRDVEWKQAAHVLNNLGLVLHIVVVLLTFAAMFFEVLFIAKS